MSQDATDIVEQIRRQEKSGDFRISRHALEEMAEEGISLEETLEAIEGAEVLEDYAEHRRGPCCLLNGKTTVGRPLHVVTTTTQPTLVIITVYEPKPPKWVSPEVRSRRP